MKEFKEKIEEEIIKYNISDNIEMVGLTDNPYPYYKGADLYVQTSLHEGYCLTIAEALLFNKYVISTDVAGAYDQITSEKIGSIIAYDTCEIAKNIENYFRNELKKYAE